MTQYQPLPRLDAIDATNFWDHVQRAGPDDCWLWTASTFTGGYGQFKAQGKTLRAHRVAYYLQYGVDPLEHLVCHSCDNPPCVNGKHLFLGTTLDNSTDMVSKGRSARLVGDRHWSKRRPNQISRGEKVGGSKLIFEQVRQIRTLYAAGGVTEQQLADQYKVSRRAIGEIIKGQNWRHAILEGEPVSLSDPRRRAKPGISHPNAKLTEDQVRQIRQRYAAGNVTYDQLSEEFGVSPETIRFIVVRRTWMHLD